MRTFVLSAVVMTSDDAPIRPWSAQVIETELHNLAAALLPGQAIVSDVALTEVGNEVPEDVAEAATVEVPLTVADEVASMAFAPGVDW
jgi:hypothetical protein